MGGGEWPFLVGGAICLVNSVNDRDLSLLTSYVDASLLGRLLRGLWPFRPRKFEAITGLGRIVRIASDFTKPGTKSVKEHATKQSAFANRRRCLFGKSVNHRVFERKLRPKPSGRGTSAWVSQIVVPHPLEDMGRKLVSVCYRTRLAKIELRAPGASRHAVKRPQRRTGPKFPGKGRQRGPNRAVNSVKAKYGRETDGEQVPRGKDEKDFEKRVKECLKLSGGSGWGRRCVPVGCGAEQSGPPIDSGRGPTRIKAVA
ncbi:hypothetical protein Bca101_101840 [Brassica carinata]